MEAEEEGASSGGDAAPRVGVGTWVGAEVGVESRETSVLMSVSSVG